MNQYDESGTSDAGRPSPTYNQEFQIHSDFTRSGSTTKRNGTLGEHVVDPILMTMSTDDTFTDALSQKEVSLNYQNTAIKRDTLEGIEEEMPTVWDAAVSGKILSVEIVD